MELSAHGLGLQRQERSLLADVNLAFRSGELAIVIGPNGAGKSTLLRTLAGLILPDRGQVRCGSDDLTALVPRQRARTIAHLPQQSALHWSMSVRDTVALGRLPHGGGAGDAAVERALQRSGLSDFADRRVDLLSQGERARVLLARVLAGETPVMLLDEPVASLDPAQALATLRLLADEAAGGRIVVVVMHDLLLAQGFAERLVLMKQGRVLGSGSANELFAAGAVGRAYGLDLPAVQFEGRRLYLPWRGDGLVESQREGMS